MFSKDKNRKDGLDIRCKECKSEYFKKNPQVKLRALSKYREKHGIIVNSRISCKIGNTSKSSKRRQRAEARLAEFNYLFDRSIIDEILGKFNLRYLSSFVLAGKYIKNNEHIKSDKIIYICVDMDSLRILKVGQTTNWKSRLVHYSYRDKTISGVFVFLFETDTWSEQDRLEVEIRKFLESKGHLLSWDNSNQRLSRIK